MGTLLSRERLDGRAHKISIPFRVGHEPFVLRQYRCIIRGTLSALLIFDEQAELLHSLDEAEREIDEGRSYDTDEMRQALRGWLGK